MDILPFAAIAGGGYLAWRLMRRSATASRFEEVKFQVSGLPRRAFVYTPPKPSGTALLLFHGGGGSGHGFAADTMSTAAFRKADAHGIIVVVLEGWRDASRTKAGHVWMPSCAGMGDPRLLEGNKLYAHAVIAQLRQHGVRRFALGGFSNGGRFLTTLVADDPSIASTVILANGSPADGQRPPGAGNFDVLLQHGAQARKDPIGGGMSGSWSRDFNCFFAPFADRVKEWTAHVGAGAHHPIQVPGTPATVRATVARSPAGRTALVMVDQAGSHEWPRWLTPIALDFIAQRRAL